MAVQERQSLGLTRFFVRYFKNFHKILLCNVIFAVPIAVLTALLSYLNNMFFEGSNIVIMSAVIIFCYPFYAGVTLVTRNIMRGDNDVKVFYTFFKGVKDNFLKFLLHGFLLYLGVLLSYFASLFYYTVAQDYAVFYALLFICLVLALALFFVFFYIPLLTVTFDLSLKGIYKNSGLMSFGEIKNNIFATIGIFFLFIFSASCVVFCTNALVFQIILGVLVGCIIPATFSAIVNFAIYDGVMNIMTRTESNAKEKTDDSENHQPEKQQSPQVDPEEFQDITNVINDKHGDGDEYIFHNGKMIKRSVLLRQMNYFDEDAENSVENSEKKEEV